MFDTNLDTTTVADFIRVGDVADLGSGPVRITAAVVQGEWIRFATSNGAHRLHRGAVVRTAGAAK